MEWYSTNYYTGEINTTVKFTTYGVLDNEITNSESIYSIIGIVSILLDTLQEKGLLSTKELSEIINTINYVPVNDCEKSLDDSTD